MKILHIITGLGDGGAEHTLYKICKYDKKNEHYVISLTDEGKYFLLLKKINTKVYNLNMGLFSIYKFFSLISILRSINPNVVQTWLVHADFLGSIASKIAGYDNIVWNVRYSKLKIGKTKFMTIVIIKILSKLSYFLPKLIIIVSKKAKKIYELEGYDKKKLFFIPNGYDLSILKINNVQKKLFRKKLKLKKKIPLIGYVARYDLLKDHLNLFKALSLIKLKNMKFYCILVGTNINKNKKLIDQINNLDLNNHVRLFGAFKNVSNIMNPLDIHIQSSRSEGFPNVVAEAMALKTPCVVTDVGDSSYIVGKTGWVVPPNNPVKLANAIKKGLNEINMNNWNVRCERARLRIRENFSINKMINSYNKVWSNIYNQKTK